MPISKVTQTTIDNNIFEKWEFNLSFITSGLFIINSIKILIKGRIRPLKACASIIAGTGLTCKIPNVTPTSSIPTAISWKYNDFDVHLLEFC